MEKVICRVYRRVVSVMGLEIVCTVLEYSKIVKIQERLKTGTVVETLTRRVIYEEVIAWEVQEKIL